MASPVPFAMIPLVLAMLLAAAPPAAPSVSITRMTVMQSVIIRIPARRAGHAARATLPPPLQNFTETKGPHCMDAGAIAGAAITAPDAVDFILKGGQRLRARLEDECPALDYYSGFYFTPPDDGRVCAGRDSIHTRSGGDCQINKFRKLKPAPAR